MAKWLTKSDYLKFLIHPAYLWLSKYDKDKLPPFDESGHYHVNQGNEVEALARSLFPDGIMIETVLKEAVTDTNWIISNGSTTLFQASVLTSRNLYARADVLVKNGLHWDIYEIKAATKVRFDHLNDLSFQKVAFTDYGYKIGQTFVVHINTRFTKDGAINPRHLFKTVNVTDRVDSILDSTKSKIIEAIGVLNLSQCPDLHPIKATNLGAWLPTYRHLHPSLEPDSIFRLKRLKPDQLRSWSQSGITKSSQISLSSKLSREQRAYIEALRLDRPATHRVKIAEWLSQLQYPLYFLDYETYNLAIPLWDKQRPYQQLPFQYSLHIIDMPGGEVRHKEFLSRGSDNPIPQLLLRLERDLGLSGSVLVWFKLFEMSCNNTMSRLQPEYASFLASVNDRVVDLMEVFSNFWYVDPNFGGSVSIKNVLPILVPEMSYADLEIHEGATAQIRWTNSAKGHLTTEENQKVYSDLITYCGQDTLAMVKIYQFLQSISSNQDLVSNHKP